MPTSNYRSFDIAFSSISGSTLRFTNRLELCYERNGCIFLIWKLRQWLDSTSMWRLLMETLADYSGTVPHQKMAGRPSLAREPGIMYIPIGSSCASPADSYTTGHVKGHQVILVQHIVQGLCKNVCCWSSETASVLLSTCLECTTGASQCAGRKLNTMNWASGPICYSDFFL